MPPRSTHDWVDDSEAPLYVVRYPAERTDRQVQEAHDAIREIYERTTRPIAWVVDASEVRSAPATQRKIVAEHERNVRPMAERWCAGLALVLPNRVVRGLFTAVTWMAPLSFPHRMFEHPEDALAWARKQLG